MCMCCNIIDADSELSSYDNTLPSNIIRAADLQYTMDEEVMDTARRLERFRAHMSAGEFQLHQQIVGMTYKGYSLLTDRLLDDTIWTVSQFMQDWMHGCYAGGIFRLLLHIVLVKLESHKIDIYNVLFQFVAQWTWPASKPSTKIEEIFDKSRRKGNKKADTFRCQASQGLSVYAVLAFWIRAFAQPRGYCPQALQAYLRFADITNLLLAVNRESVTPAKLLTSVERFLEAFVAEWEEKL